MGRLTRRREFLAAATGKKAHSALFTLQAFARTDDRESPARIGATVTRKVGTAVERNRIRRRLRAATRDIAAREALPGHDYVIVARRAVLDAPYDRLVADLAGVFRRLHRTNTRTARPPVEPGLNRLPPERPDDVG